VLASLIPGARYVTVPEAGHSVYWERAETFNRLVGGFLRDVDGTL
jgi:pimeloyl-ACP methyl ester carboxylesterase